MIITNVFGDLGETEFIFENKSANALVDQEILFTLTDIPIKQIFTDDEDSLFSVELKTEGESSENKSIITTQISNIASKAHSNCYFVCKTLRKSGQLFTLQWRISLLYEIQI